MLVIGFSVHGDAVVAATGLGHTLAYTLGAVVLAIVIRRRVGHAIFPRALIPTTVLAGASALVAWLVHQRLDPSARSDAFAFLAVVGIIGGGIYLVVWRRARGRMQELKARRPAGDDLDGLEDPDVSIEN